MDISKNQASRPRTLAAFADRLLRLMPRMLQSQVKYERNYLARGLITLPQLWILRQVAEMGICSMHALAQAQGVRASTVTGLVDRLVALGLLQRRPSATDRRAVLAMITPKGRKIMEALHGEKRATIIGMFRHVSARERMAYLEIVEKIAKALAPEQDPSAPSGANQGPIFSRNAGKKQLPPRGGRGRRTPGYRFPGGQ